MGGGRCGGKRLRAVFRMSSAAMLRALAESLYAAGSSGGMVDRSGADTLLGLGGTAEILPLRNMRNSLSTARAACQRPQRENSATVRASGLIPHTPSLRYSWVHFLLLNSLPIHCPADPAVPSASCSASSDSGGAFTCESAFDSDPESDWATRRQGVGSWIQSNFGAEYLVTRFEYRHRIFNEDNRQITLSFSDGSTQSFVLQDDIRSIQPFAVSPGRTSFVRLTVDSVYETVDNGARQIIFYGELVGRSVPVVTRSEQQGCSALHPCPECHGDCDSDGDCAGYLQCFQRNLHGEYPPRV